MGNTAASSKDNEETNAVPETADEVLWLYTLNEINLIHSIHVTVCDHTSMCLTCMS